MPSTSSCTGAPVPPTRRSQTAVDNGVIKMNIDTDTQYAFTRPAVTHMFTNYDGVIKIDGEVGNKKAYDPRAWGKTAEAGHGRTPGRGQRRTSARPAPTCEQSRS